jgi:hypothetical protein
LDGAWVLRLRGETTVATGAGGLLLSSHTLKIVAVCLLRGMCGWGCRDSLVSFFGLAPLVGGRVDVWKGCG